MAVRTRARSRSVDLWHDSHERGGCMHISSSFMNALGIVHFMFAFLVSCLDSRPYVVPILIRLHFNLLIALTVSRRTASSLQSFLVSIHSSCLHSSLTCLKGTRLRVPVCAQRPTAHTPRNCFAQVSYRYNAQTVKLNFPPRSYKAKSENAYVLI